MRLHHSPIHRTMTLKSQFALAIGGLIAVFSVFFTFWTVWQVSIEERANVIDSQRALLHATATDLEEKLELRKDAIATIGPLFPEEILNSPGEINSFFKPRPVLRKIFDSVLIVDDAGRIKYRNDVSGSLALEPTFLTQDFLAEALGAKHMVVSNVQANGPGTDAFIGFAIGLRSKSGAPFGVLIGTLNVNHQNFLKELGQVRIGKVGYFALIDERANPQFIVDGQSQRAGEFAVGGRQNPIMQEALAGRAGYVEDINSKGIPTLRTYTPLQSVPWLLVAVYPTEEAFAGLRARARGAIEVGACLFLIGSLAAWLMTHWLLRPLTRLRKEIENDELQSHLGNPRSYGGAEVSALAKAYHAQSNRRSWVEDQLRTSERRLQKITDNLPALIAYVDPQWRYTFANAQYQRIFGDNPAEMVGKTIREIRGEAQHTTISGAMALAQAGQVVTFERSDVVDGKEYFFRSEYIPDIDEDNRVAGVYVLSVDISPLKAAQAIQLATEHRLRAITDNLPGLIAYVGHDQIVQFINRTFSDWYGLRESEVQGHHFRTLFGEAEYREHHQKHIVRCLAGQRVAFEWQSTTNHGDRVFQVIFIPDVTDEGIVAGFYALYTDVTELKQTQSTLENLVRRDALTGVANRYQFNEQLPLIMKRCRTEGVGLAVAFLDLDHFKSINDKFGHASGDLVLKEFAARLLLIVRTSDLVARLAGDEFVVVLEGLHAQGDADAIAMKIVMAMVEPIKIWDVSIVVTTSIGIAYEQIPVSPPKDFLANADAALYKAKEAGRNRYAVFGA
jgi:diguanylate cyclase (GGDEF)-like protein/PAS domain S-box-containing protein